MSEKSNNSGELRNVIENYLKYWKLYIVAGFVFLTLAFLKIRYSTESYNIKATIKIANNNRDQGILEEVRQVNQYGLFNEESNQINDEIEILKSRALLKNIVEDLNLNIQIFQQGKIMASEVYKNPPIIINFLSNDSIIKKIDTTLTININNNLKFSLQKEGKKYGFGERVSSTIGEFIITPNVDDPNYLSNKDITIKLIPVEKMIEYYSKNIIVNHGGEESSMINISLIDPKPDKGKDIINRLIQEYNNQIVENKNRVVEETSNFINNRLQVVSSELSQVDLTAETIKKDNRLTDLSTQSNIYLQSERDIESQLRSTSTQLELIDYMSDFINENNNTGDLIPSNLSFENNSVNEITARHNDLVIQRNRILKNSSEINPVVVNLDEEINSLKQSLNSSLSNIKSSYQIRLDALNTEDSKISSKIYSAPRKERQFRDLNRQQNIKESLYLYLLQKREESAISHGVSSPNAIVINEAFSSYKPVAPKKSIIVLSALIFALLIPTLFIYAKDLLDNKFHNVEDLRKMTSIPILGDIPKSKTKNSIIKKVDYSPKAEAFRLIRTNIDFLLSNIPKDEGKVIFVTSTTSQEGKSHTSINLSKSLSFSNKKVLLIETDIRVPKANKYLKIDCKIGITNYLVDNKVSLTDAITHVDDNLDVLSSGTIPPNPAELLMSDKMEELFKTVKQNYDYIVVDTAAVGLVTDTLIISKYADMVVYVVRANYLDKRQFTVAETMYNEKRLPKMSILLNSVKSKKGYGYGYGNSPDAKKKSKWKLT